MLQSAATPHSSSWDIEWRQDAGRSFFVFAVFAQQPAVTTIRALFRGERLSAPFVEAFRRELGSEQIRLEIVRAAMKRWTTTSCWHRKPA